MIKPAELSSSVENLVITSQDDGTYKSEVVVYTFLDNNQMEIKTAPLENFNTSDYLSRVSFSYTCTTTVTYNCVQSCECSGGCGAYEATDVSTSCNYHYYNSITQIDSGGGGGGSGNGGGWGVWTGGGGGGGSSSGSGSGTNTTTTTTVTSPNIDLGSDLLHVLGIGNLNPSSQDSIILNWINDNYGTGGVSLMGTSNPFFDVYNFYLENNSVPSITDVIREIILTLDADSSLTFDEALFAYTNNYFANNLSEFTPTYVYAPNDIINISDYMDCFDTATASDNFEMTIYVKQPVPGKRDPYKIKDILTSDVDVGHTFLSLNMTPSGISTGSINQTIGFYPDPNNLPDLDNPNTSSVMVDNGQHDYNISVTTPLTFSQFQNVITYLEGVSSSNYDLNNLNCTDIGIQAAAAGGLTLPDTTGTWSMFFVGSGSGSNPGDLGEDIRALNNPNVTVNSTPNTGPLSNGLCN